MMWLRLLVLFLVAIATTGAAVPLRSPSDTANVREIDPSSGTYTFFGSLPGYETLDRGVNPGNPFATAFLQALDSTTLGEFSTQLSSATKLESSGFQIVDSPQMGEDERRQTSLSSRGERKIALVLVVSDYDQINDLPGARFDALRVYEELRQIGFDATLELDSNTGSIARSVSRFSEMSRTADVALIYATGHGMQIDGETRLIHKDFRPTDGKSQLPDHSTSVRKMSALPMARRLNVVLFAGCRNNPLRW